MKFKFSQKTILIIFIVILIVAGFMRLFMLDNKPLHHDEAEEQFYYIKSLLEYKPLIWDYDNKGLAQHYLSVVFSKVFGLTTFALRLGPVFFSLLSIALLYLFRPYLGKYGFLFSAIFFAVSPIMVYYAKMYTSYPFLGFFLYLFIYYLFKFYMLPSFKNLMIISIIAAIILNIHLEAFVIFIFILISFFYFLFLFDNKYYLLIINKIKQIPWQQYLFAGITGLIIFTLLQTCLLLKMENLANILNAIFAISQKAVETGHNKPIYYYWQLFWPVEIAIFIFSFIGIFLVKKSLFSKFLIYWALVSFAIFSLIPYKANWVSYIILLPWILMAANSFDLVVKKFARFKKIIYILTIILLILSLLYSIDQNFINQNNLAKNRLGYVETTTDVFRLTKDINSHFLTKTDSKILISGGSFWPLPMYLLNYQPMYLNETPQANPLEYPDYDILIMDNSAYGAQLANQYEFKRYELRQYYFIDVYYKK